MATYTRNEVEKFRKFGDVTENGVAFDWWLVNADGAGFCLVREPHQTEQDIELARRYIKRERDVVGKIRVATIS